MTLRTGPARAALVAAGVLASCAACSSGTAGPPSAPAAATIPAPSAALAVSPDTVYTAQAASGSSRAAPVGVNAGPGAASTAVSPPRSRHGSGGPGGPGSPSRPLSRPAAVLGHLQQVGTGGEFLIPVDVSLVNQSDARVCADGTPTVAYDYIGADHAWHDGTLTGMYTGLCAAPHSTVFLMTLLATESDGDSPPRARVLGVTMQLTGPDGSRTATGF